MNKIFIDCGGHIGESILRFKRSSEYDESFIIHSFEPVPHLAKYYKHWRNIFYHNKAIWVKDGEIKFYIDTTHDKASGSTLNINKKSGKLDKNNPVIFPCIDFDNWIKDNFNKNDYIILKMDIEGAEYDVLTKMIKKGSINYINKAYIEFHWKKIGLSKLCHNNLLDKLNEIKNLKLLPEMHKFEKISN